MKPKYKRKLDWWMALNYELFLHNNGFLGTDSLRKAFLSGYNFRMHTEMHGTPDQSEIVDAYEKAHERSKNV